MEIARESFLQRYYKGEGIFYCVNITNIWISFLFILENEWNDLLRFFQKEGAITKYKILIIQNCIIKLNNNSFKLSYLKRFKINRLLIWFDIILLNIPLRKINCIRKYVIKVMRVVDEHDYNCDSLNRETWIKQAKRYLAPCYPPATVLFTVSSPSREIRCVSVYYSLWCVPISAKFRATGIPFRNSVEEGA